MLGLELGFVLPRSTCAAALSELLASLRSARTSSCCTIVVGTILPDCIRAATCQT